MAPIRFNAKLVGLRFAVDHAIDSAPDPQTVTINSEFIAAEIPPTIDPTVDRIEEPSPTHRDANDSIICGLIGELLESCRELESRRQQSIEELQQAAVEIGLRAAAKVLRDVATECRLPLTQYIREATTRLSSGRSITIRLNSDDLAALDQRAAESPEWREIVATWPPVADAELARGTVIVDASDFGLMTSIEQQLMDIRQTLLEGISNAQVERRRSWGPHGGLRRFPDRRETA